MAADNYSDVVQVLAQQIVDACTRLIPVNVQKQVLSANIDASQITGDMSLITGTASSVDAGSVIGLNQAVANAIANSNINISQIVNFDESVGVAVEKATIKWADIETLSADIAQIAVAEIAKANIDAAKITNLVTEFAKIAKTEVGNAIINAANIDWANITWASIQNNVSQNSIFTNGVGGKLYIRDLAVTEANIVSLSVGELIVKGDGGLFYAITVDKDGKIKTEQKQVETKNIADSAINNDKIANNTINGATKILEGSITVDRLNANEIFANSALVEELIAANINVDTLFGREATIAKINTMDITSNTYLQEYVGNNIDNAIINMTPDSISAKVMASDDFTAMYPTRDDVDDAIDGIVIGGRNFIRNSKDMILEGTHGIIVMENMNGVGYAIVGVSIVE